MKTGGTTFHHSTLKSLLKVAPLLLVMAFHACYSSTAVTGTPVNEVPLIKEEALAKKKKREMDREALSRMSQIKGNKVFIEIKGVPEYRIGPLDILIISSRVGEKVREDEITVNLRGRISYSFIDDIQVTGLTPSQVDRLLTKKLAAYLRNPRIDILVKEFKSKSAMVLGELSNLRASTYSKAQSGRIQLEGRTTLVDLIAQAGGYTIDADIKNLKLIRQGKTYIINLFDIIERGEKSLNVIIDDGDVVDIPELPEFGERVYVMGEVMKQGVYPLEDAQDLLAAISLAENVTSLAKEESTLIVREYEPGKKPLVMMSDLKALLRNADLSQNIPLKDGDLVYVPRMRIGDINDWIENTQPFFDLLFWPARFEDSYFLRWYMHFDKRKPGSPTRRSN